MIKNFKSKNTEKLFKRKFVKRFEGIERQALIKLDRIDAALTLEVLAAMPGNRFEALKGDRKGQYSIRINNQWRICFRWEKCDALDVEIVDYH
jgi:toxin HigB-1